MVSIVIRSGGYRQTYHMGLGDISVRDLLDEFKISFSNPFRFVLDEARKIDQRELRPGWSFDLNAENVMGKDTGLHARFSKSHNLHGLVHNLREFIEIGDRR